MSYNLHSQEVIKLRAKYFCFKTYSYYYGWSDWSEWEPANILIVLDFSDERITIFANETNYLDIYDYDTDYQFDKTVYYLWCIDNYARRCRVRFVFYKNDLEYNQIYIDYSNCIIVYSIKPLIKY